MGQETFYYQRNFTEAEQTMTNTRGRYGFLNFLFDVFMVCITFGFWLIWIFVRELRG